VVDDLKGRAAGCTYLVAVTTGAAAKKKLESRQPIHIIHYLNQIAFIFRESLQPTVQ
jgi:phosphoglycolate phosphatase-like HAD superfamily hydrolase